MQEVKSISIALVAMLFFTVCAMGAVGIDAAASLEASATGKATVSVDLAPTLNGTPYEGELYGFVHDASTDPSTRILIRNITVPGVVEFEIALVAEESGNQVDSYSSSMAYKMSSIYIHVTDPKGLVSGGIVMSFDASALDGALEAPINLVVAESVDSDFSTYPGPHEKMDRYTDANETTNQTEWLKAGELHSINGITVRWCVEADGADQTVIYLQSYERTITYNLYFIPPCKYDTNWISCGKLPCYCVNDGSYAQASGNARYEVLVKTIYSCEMLYTGPDIGNPYTEQYYYFMKPVMFNDVDEGASISCNYCNTTHPGYASDWETGDNNPFHITFTRDTTDNTRWKFSSVDFSFSFGIGIIDFETTIALYRAYGDATEGSEPFLEVTVNSGSPLYSWHDSNDPTKYIVHFSWS